MPSTIQAEDIASHPEFRRLHAIEAVRVDLRYASRENFVGRDLYSPLDCAWLHRDAALALEASARSLAGLRPDLRLLVIDALRPQRVQEALWKHLEGTGLQSYIANPERGSIHSFGMAVDVTLVDARGHELDMGTPFDDMTPRSHPALEEGYARTGEITATQVANRQVLREAMRQGGWVGISTEWWHFDCGDRLRVRAEYARIL